MSRARLPDMFPLHPDAYPIVPRRRGIPFLYARLGIIRACLESGDVASASFVADQILRDLDL